MTAVVTTKTANHLKPSETNRNQLKLSATTWKPNKAIRKHPEAIPNYQNLHGKTTNRPTIYQN